MVLLILLSLAAFFVMSQRFVYRRWWDKRLTFSVTLDAEAVFEGETLHITETLENAKPLPLPLVEVTLFTRSFMPISWAGGAQSAKDRRDKSTHVFSVPANRRVSASARYICTKRGYYPLNKFLVSGCDLMVTGWRTRYMDGKKAVTVYPRIINADTINLPYRQLAGEILSRRFIVTDPLSFRGIRAYQPGDRLKDINFNATARTGEWMTNLCDGTVTQEIVLVLNLQAHRALIDTALCEGAIRLAAFLARYFIGQGIPVALLSNGRDAMDGLEASCAQGVSLGHLYHLYELLARIDLMKKPRSMMQLLAEHKPDANRVYLLISRYDGADLAAWFETARPYGAYWAVPYRTGDNKIRILFDDRIAGYEVTEEADA